MRYLLPLAAAVLTSVAATDARALEQDPQCKHGVGSTQQRIEACSRVISQTRASPAATPVIADALETRGLARAEQGDCASGIGDVKAAIDMIASRNDLPVQRQRYMMHVNGANIYLNCAGDFDSALAILGRATKFRPAEPIAYAGRGLMFSEKGDYRSAYAELARGLSLAYNNPTKSFVLTARGAVLMRQGRLDEALAVFDESARLYPAYAYTYSDRGNTWRLKGDLARALTDLNIAVRQYPGNASFLARRGDILRYRGDFAEAMADFNRALAINPFSVPALTGRGLIYERLGDTRRARADFEGAVASPFGVIYRVREARETAVARLAALDAAAQVAAAVPAKTMTVATAPASVPAAAPVAAAPAVRQGRRVALVIGNSAYRRVPELINPRNDANAIAASLRGVGFDSVLQVSDTTRETMGAVLQAFANEAAAADWAMVYYAGHGIEVNGQNFLIPVEARLAADRDARSETIPLEHVMAALQGARKLKLVVLDACRDNPFAPQMQRTATVADAAAAMPSMDGDVATRSIGRGLGEVRVTGATLVVFAAKHGQTALDGQGGNSPFALAFAQRMATPGVEINKIFRLVRDDVMEATAGRQEPYTYGSLPGREDFFFVAGR